MIDGKSEYQKYKEYHKAYRKKNAKKISKQKAERLANKEPNKKCEICENGFFSYKSTTKFCSRDCFVLDMKESRKGKKNPAYRNGMFVSGNRKDRNSERGFNPIRQEVKDDIISVHGHICCERCNINRGTFELHHIIFRSEAPKHENLHNRKNAILLCMKCHNYFHRKKSNRDYLVEERGLAEIFPDIYKLKNIKMAEKTSIGEVIKNIKSGKKQEKFWGATSPPKKRGEKKKSSYKKTGRVKLDCYWDAKAGKLVKLKK